MMVSQLPAISPANKTKTCRHANRLSAQAAKVELFREWAEEADREPENFRTALAAEPVFAPFCGAKPLILQYRHSPIDSISGIPLRLHLPLAMIPPTDASIPL